MVGLWLVASKGCVVRQGSDDLELERKGTSQAVSFTCCLHPLTVCLPFIQVCMTNVPRHVINMLHRRLPREAASSDAEAGGSGSGGGSSMAEDEDLLPGSCRMGPADLYIDCFATNNQAGADVMDEDGLDNFAASMGFPCPVGRMPLLTPVVGGLYAFSSIGCHRWPNI